MTLTRKTPLKPKRSKPRRVLTPPELQCARCTALATVLEWCPKHAREEADRLFSIYIRNRDGRCVVCTVEYPVEQLQAMHGVSRGKYATRWDPANAWAGCVPCHFGFTNDDNAWTLWMEERIGPETLGALRFKARRGGMPDVGWVILELRGWLEGLGVAA